MKWKETEEYTYKPGPRTIETNNEYWLKQTNKESRSAVVISHVHSRHNVPKVSFAKKYANCDKCDFYQMVEKEEGPRLQLALFLLEKLKRG